MSSNNSTGSTTDASLSGIAESRVFAYQAVPDPLVNSATSRHTKLLPPSRLIIRSCLPARHREAGTIKSQFTIGKSDIRNTFYLLICTAWARGPKLNITWDMFENQTAFTEQLLNEQKYQLDAHFVRLEKNRGV